MVDIGRLVPKGEDWVPRELARIERQAKENLASVAQSFAGTVADLQAAQADLAAQQAALTDLVNSQIVSANGWSNNDGFGLTTTNANINTFSLTVPAGYTKALVDASGVMFVINPTTNVDYLYHRIWIDSPPLNGWSRELLSMIGPNNGSAALTVLRKTYITGLTGGQTITIRQTARTAFQSMSASANGATAEALVLFVR